MKILSEVDAACMSDESTLTNFLDWGLTHAREVSSQHVASIL
jgi:hypothetical protein